MPEPLQPLPLHQVRMDLAGRLRNTRVAQHDAFLPLFEAVVNSIHSTQDRYGDRVGSDGWVRIQVTRVPQAQVPGLGGRPPVEDIQGIIVTDNGEGFTDRNLTSFETADSDAKLDRGGKGIGRFTWLVVFSRAEVKSSYRAADGQQRRRSFVFSPVANGIGGFTEELDPSELTQTEISLLGPKQSYLESLRKGANVIADLVFEHCFNYLILGRCPRITLIDSDSGVSTPLVLNERCAELTFSDRMPLTVGEHALEVRHVRQRYSSGRKHMGHLLADDRVVASFPLPRYSDLTSEPLDNESGDPEVHHVYVSGKSLDSAADSTRTHFALPDREPVLEAGGLLDLETLRKAVGAAVNEYLRPWLAAARKQNLERLERHIKTTAPEYAKLLQVRQDELSRVKWSDNAKVLDESLYKIKQNWEQEIHQKQAEVEASLSTEGAEVKDFADKLYSFVSQANLAGQDDLVRYVVKRRAVLQVLSQLLSRHQHALEEDIHRIVFPLRRTNSQIDYYDHNLWLVDDALSFYEFIASDRPLAQQEAGPFNSNKRPDILAFKTGDPFQHVSLIEFKRPDLDKTTNPVSQLVDYATLLRRGGELGANEMTLPRVSKNIRIDAYAIVSITPQMEEVLPLGPGEMKTVEGESRWYGRIEALNMNVDILDFSAFVRRAQQRNMAFFRALKLTP